MALPRRMAGVAARPGGYSSAAERARTGSEEGSDLQAPIAEGPRNVPRPRPARILAARGRSQYGDRAALLPAWPAILSCDGSVRGAELVTKMWHRHSCLWWKTA